MKRIIIPAFVAAVTAVWPIKADEQDAPPPPTNRPNVEELRSRARSLSPEEREARVKELRSRLGGAGTNHSELEKRRDEWRRLSPAERETRMREFREKRGNPNQPRFQQLTPAERETKRKEFKQRLDGQIKEIESRQTNAPLTETEQRRLERYRQMGRKLDQGTALGSANRPEKPSGKNQ